MRTALIDLEIFVQFQILQTIETQTHMTEKKTSCRISLLEQTVCLSLLSHDIVNAYLA